MHSKGSVYETQGVVNTMCLQPCVKIAECIVALMYLKAQFTQYDRLFSSVICIPVGIKIHIINCQLISEIEKLFSLYPVILYLVANR